MQNKDTFKLHPIWAADARLNYVHELIDKKLYEQNYSRNKMTPASKKHRVPTRDIQLAAAKILDGKKLLKKDFLRTKASDVAFESGDEFRDLVIRFDHALGSVKWSVAENNHAHDNAVDSFLGHSFLQIMSSFKWTPRTGGIIQVSSEYDNGGDQLSPPRIAFSFGGKVWTR